MHVCKYLKQRVRTTGEKNGQSFKFVSKTKEKKKHEETEFHNSIQDRVLLPWINCRKLLVKMADISKLKN